MSEPLQPEVDVVVVAHASRQTLRACLEPLAGRPGLTVTVVDTASADDGFDTVADLAARLDRAPRNGGFAYGCNRGAAFGTAPYVLFLNPDARISEADTRRLVAALEEHPRAGLVAPRILGEHGEVEPSRRREPSVARMFATAFFLHRLAPNASWSDEMVRDPQAYAVAGEAEWVSGACMLVRRAALEEVGGLDAGFFLYAEDTDLCVRLRAAGWAVHFEPAASVIHAGGHSMPRDELRIVDVRSRIRYALVHGGVAHARVTAIAVACFQATHALARAHRGGASGHLAGLRAALEGVRDPRSTARLAAVPPWDQVAVAAALAGTAPEGGPVVASSTDASSPVSARRS